MAGNGVASPAFDLAQGPLELVVCERLDLAAVVADQVVVVFAPGVDRLEARSAGADVDALDEAVLAQLLENTVDARDPDAAAFGAKLVEDFLGSQAAVLAAEQLDDGAARTAVSVSPRLQGSDRRLRPGRLRQRVHGR